MKNKLTDLNDILFAQLERLGDEGLKDEAIANEVERAKAIVAVADRIVDNARLQLDAATLIADHGVDLRKRLPATLGLPSGEVQG
jgi:fructose-specific phosphotransferase system component IIB